tara:strand:- start:1893 stop:2981 length:1089 start_codon:yes stop_codon:yes gene_type:complete
MSLVHETILHIDLAKLKSNAHYLRSQLSKKTEVIAVVKAHAYGLGDYEIAAFLETLGVKHFWVADFEEGVSLREQGIQGSIIIANPGSKSVQEIKSHKLEPVIYNFRLFELYAKQKTSFNIHLKLNTGMNRYGFNAEELDDVLTLLHENPQLKVKTVCSHLAASDEIEKDDYTRCQIELFEKLTSKLKNELKTPFKRHILNTNGMLRHPQYQMEMVRIGIGLYGVSDDKNLQQICRLESAITQIRNIKKGEKIGYRNAFEAPHDMRIAIIPIGYADGLNRKLGDGKGKVLVDNKECAILGHVSMDSFVADISDTNAQEGDMATIFSADFSIQKIANDLNTIPYEILATINRRIKRIYDFPTS